MKPSPVFKKILLPFLIILAMQFACSFSAQPSNPTTIQPNNASTTSETEPATLAPSASSATPTQPGNASTPTQAATSTLTLSAPNGSPKAGQVVVSGAVNKNYTPVSVEAGTLGSSMIINLHETTTDGISLAFPPDTQPGTYTIQDHLNNAVVDFSGEYVQWKSDAFYLSTDGTLTLTVVGSKFSGQFEFTGVNSKDASKTIKVTGSFTNVPVTP